MNSKPITFAEIFNINIKEDIVVNSIEIPIIQRDYAQGRESKEVGRIRTQFLSVLFDALTGNNDPVNLDFVYGNISDAKLIPLDGQQRLTTLFLLHWYIAKKENIDREKYEFLTNFTYRTRFSSTHFCENLMDATPDFSIEKLSNWITDQSWYMYSWDYDPTICSMLVMLNDIHSFFKNESDLWSKITNVKNPLISFYFLPLEDMGLTDSLYIKMNSRGKPLSGFEHFKAEFETIIKDVSVDLYNEFIQKVDNDWVDMLWKYRGDDDAVDDEFMRYFRFITETICFQKEIEIAENDFDLAREVYSKKNIDAADNFKFLFKAFDCWKVLNNIDDFFNTTFSKYNSETGKVVLFSEDNNLFLECCNKYGLWVGRRREFTLNNTLLLYAILVYLINKEQVNDYEFKERIRIIRNLVMNSPDEIREERMKALLNDIQNIILKNEINLKNLGFNEVQKNQELEKINWRQKYCKLISDLNKLEDHFLLQGSIAVIGLEESEKLKQRVANFYKLFNKKIDYITISKALLTINDYSQLASWRFLLGNKLDSSWRELFTISKQRKNFEQTKETLLSVLDSIKGEFNDYLDNLIKKYVKSSETPKDWKYYFVKYTAMRQGQSGVYWWRNDPSKTKENQYEIIMMNTPLSLNGRHWDPFLFAIYNDEDFKEEFTLDEYGAPLLNSKNEKIKCVNKAWHFYDYEDNLITTIDIPQENGIDNVDRIELLKNKLQKKKNA